MFIGGILVLCLLQVLNEETAREIIMHSVFWSTTSAL